MSGRIRLIVLLVLLFNFSNAQIKFYNKTSKNITIEITINEGSDNAEVNIYNSFGNQTMSSKYKWIKTNKYSWTNDYFNILLSNEKGKEVYYTLFDQEGEIKAIQSLNGILYQRCESFPNILNTKYYIGQHFQGGIIFFIDSTGFQGLISSERDVSEGDSWTQGDYKSTNATGKMIWDGKSNTDKIISVHGQGNYAAIICKNYKGGGYSDWYLPSYMELLTLYEKRFVVGGFNVNKEYWSSTEITYNGASGISFDFYNHSGDGRKTDGALTFIKGGILPIRAIRRFKDNDLNHSQVNLSKVSIRKNATDYYNSGVAKYEIEDYNKALIEFSEAIKLNPKFADAYEYRGNTKNDLKDYLAAIKDFTKAIELDPNNVTYFNNRGNAKFELKDYKGAIADYSKAIELSPSPTVADVYFFNRGNAKFEIEDYSGAIKDYSKSIELDPKYASAYNSRALSNVRLKNYSGVINDYSKAIEIDSTSDIYFYNRGDAKFELKDYKGAISDYSKSIEINPKDGDYYFGRGKAKRDLGDSRASILDFDKSIELNQEDYDAYNLRGNAKFEIEDYSGAIKDYSKLIKLNPKNALAYYLKGVSEEMLKPKGGCSDLRKSVELGYKEAVDMLKKYCK